MLENQYLPTLGSDNLKEVEGYKIRLITTEELNANLGWVNLNTTAYSGGENANVPTWVCKNFGDSRDSTDSNYGVWKYWTMTPHPEDSSSVWYVDYNGEIDPGEVYPRGNHAAVRPVINLLKSSI